MLAIREATAADLDALAALWKELADLHAVLEARYRLVDNPDAQVRDFLALCLQDPGWHFLLAEEDGRAVGFMSGLIKQNSAIMPVRRYGYIEDAAVTVAARRRGIGEELCAEMEAWFAGRGIKVVQMNAAARNPIAQGFWHKMGYTDLSVRMQKELV